MFVPTLLSTPALATVVTCDDGAGEHLPAGDATTDLRVTGPCEVKAGTYIFHDVNIFKNANAANGGSLSFDDVSGIDFFAESILIENGGSLIAGSPPGMTPGPIGSTCLGGKCGRVTIHLWGKQTDPGITCKSDDKNQCGVDDDIWTSNMPSMNPMSCNPKVLPGNVNDCFYPYDPLDASDMRSDKPAYFGHKVLAVSFGGTLQLFGKKGATYSTLGSSQTGTSWVRLKGSLKPGGATSLTVDGVVDWQDKDHIVVTTTDYLPGHSEELIINGTPTVSGNTTTIQFINADGVTNGVKYPHNGQTFDLSTTSYPGISPLNLNMTSAETRAAVALLTRSIQIVSGGDTPSTSFPPEPTNGSVGYYFGGHTIVRQGFRTYQVQGVQFYQLGQGGSIMHYPVHFHMARQTPGVQTTFVKDSSVWDSMTRWITIHGTQGVQLARNVGYKSIGHGYYLEDGTETNNQLYANIGIFARAAVANPQNKRSVPGILTTNDTACNGTNPPCAIGYDNFPYYSDANHPAVFWIMNGWNDFEYNMAAGAGTCGACYWFVPGAISGASRMEKWFGYASEQRSVLSPNFFERAGTTPLQTFVGNSCTSAMNAFQEVGNTAVCNGVNFITQNDTSKNLPPLPPNSTLKMLPSQEATTHYPPNKATDLYWPIVSGGGRLATRCPDADKGIATADCSTNASAQMCDTGTRANCDVTVLDGFTTAFNWAQKNFSAIWMRPFWSLVINSVISDVQSAGLNFVTSGDFSKSSVIDGFWALARKSVFIGSTQWQNPKNDLSDNPLASNAGPFNPFKSKDGNVTGLTCGPNPFGGVFNPSFCLSQAEGISIQLEAFTNFQRMFSVYDGPAYQDSNAYLNIQPTYLTKDGTVTGDIFPGCVAGACPVGASGCNPCATVGFKDSFLSGVRADNLHKLCYLPNAAIGWKQSNGFYYSPAFHSTNLFFDSVGIRHFVTEPLFNSTGVFDFTTDLTRTSQEYCQWENNFFNNFTDIDRETVLNDDDGTLTGLTSPVNQPTVAKTETISVNKEDFFDAPSETPECASDLPLNTNGPSQAGDAKCPPNTAKTSPYEYVTTALYPECALTAAPPTMEMPLSVCNGGSWGSACSSQPLGDPILGCAGVPLYRQLLTANEKPGLKQVKRMMGQNTFQRSGLTVNNGVYYIDTTVSKATQTNPNGVNAKSINVFTAGQKYDVFFLYANKNTSQKYQLFVGKEIPNTPGTNRDFGQTNVKFGYVNITTNKYTFALATPPGMNKNPGDLPDGWISKYDSPSGILSVTTDMSTLADDFDFTKNNLGVERCQPATMCTWTPSNQCECNRASPYFKSCNETSLKIGTVCSWSVKDVDCPAQGCPAFQITLPAETYFKATDQEADCLSAKPVTCVRPMPADFNFGSSFNWNIGFNLEDSTIAGQQCTYTPSQQPPLACTQ